MRYGQFMKEMNKQGQKRGNVEMKRNVFLSKKMHISVFSSISWKKTREEAVALLGSDSNETKQMLLMQGLV